MKRHTREGQIKTIQRIQTQVKTYIRWKKCGTVASFFTRYELDQHLFNLNLIFTLTDESKIAIKTSQLIRLLAIILEKEYDEKPKFHLPPILKRDRSAKKKQDGSSSVPSDQTISPTRDHANSLRNKNAEKAMGKHVQKIQPNRGTIVQDK